MSDRHNLPGSHLSWIPRLEPAMQAAAVVRLPGSPDPVGAHRLFASSSGSGDSGQSVTVKRRRQSATGSQTEGRADASTRPSGGSGGSGGSSGSGGGGPKRSGGLGGGGSVGGIGGIVTLVLAVVAYLIFGRGGGDSQPSAADLPAAAQQAAQQGGSASQAVTAGLFGNLVQGAFDQGATPAEPELVVRPTQAPAASSPSSPSPSGESWTIMLYQDADDQVLEQDIYIDLNEAEKFGSTDNVTIVAQFDRFQGGFNGDGNWTSTKRFLIGRDDDLTRVSSQELADLGEVNMADGDTLVDFITWAAATYPADKYALVFSDHGMGWPGGWSDPTGNDIPRDLPLASAIGHDMLWLNEMDEALGRARQQAGIDKFELIGFDACLMAHIEVFTAMAPHARFSVASQETEPAVGWAYTAFLSALNENPAMNGGELGAAIVRSYITEDQRVVDDQARAGFARGSADAVARQLGQGITLTAADLSHIPELNEAFSNFAYAIQGVDQKAVAKARTYAQSYTSIFGSDVPPSYLDMGNFMGLVVQAAGNDQLQAAALEVAQVIEKTVVAEKHGPGKPGSFGISIYFPNSQLYQSAAAGPRSYNVAAERFVNESAWDEFLAFHYTGRQFAVEERTLAAPAAGFASRSPAAGGITISPIELSASSVDPDGSLSMSAEISGENIGYVRLLIGMWDPESNSMHLLDTDYLEAPETQEMNGVFYPVWPEGSFTMNFEFEPIVTAITDGQTRDEALLQPLAYGRSADDAVYGVDGVYTYADGTRRFAQAQFRDGYLRQIFAFTEEDGTGMPRELVPTVGDTFTIIEDWLDENGQPVNEVGTTLTFGTETFEWQNLIAAAGEYTVGFIVEDLDGNEYPSYSQITVNE